MSIYTLSKTLDFLHDETSILAEVDFTALSDLNQEGVRHFQHTWDQLSSNRREDLIRRLGEIAQERIELDFEAINRFALSDSIAAIRQMAIENLWECEEPELAKSFIESLSSDPDPGVRSAAASALGKFIYLGELERISPDLLRKSEDTLLTSVREDLSPVVRDRALESLGYSSLSEVVYLIEDAYDSELDDTRIAALVAMRRSADDSWSEHVLSEVQNSNPAMRAEVVRAIGELEIQEGLDALLELLGDENLEVIRASIWALSELGGNEAREAISMMLEYAEDEQDIELLEDALDNLVFVDSTRDILAFDEPEDSMA